MDRIEYYVLESFVGQLIIYFVVGGFMGAMIGLTGV